MALWFRKYRAPTGNRMAYVQVSEEILTDTYASEASTRFVGASPLYNVSSCHIKLRRYMHESSCQDGIVSRCSGIGWLS